MGIPCVVDSSVVLNLCGARALPILVENLRYDWKVTPLVRGEVRNAECRMALERAIIESRLQLMEIDTTSADETRLWGEWSTRLDAGEAETLVLAVARGWLIAVEDRKAQRAMDQSVGTGRWINCANVLLDGVDDGRVSLAEADEAFSKLSCFSGYRKRGVTSLRDLRSRAG